MLRAVREFLAPGFRLKLRRHFRQFLRDTDHCRQVQARTLKRLLRLNAGSDFQRDFQLDRACSVAAFQRALPVANYERAAPYVQRLVEGDVQALLGRRNPLTMFARTSGTTSSSKLIPIPRRFVRDYRRGWQCWGIRAFDDHPLLHRSEIFQLSTRHDQFRTPGNIPCGNISGLVQKMQSRILRSMYCVPASASTFHEPLEKLTFALKYGLCSRQLGMMLTANPSTLCQLFRLLHERGPTLVRDLRDGTDSENLLSSLPPQWRRLRYVSRARELDRLLEIGGRLQPQQVWPQLQLIAVWTGGSAAAYLPQLREYVGEIPIRDHGLHASEGRMTIPLEDETSQGVLDISSHFFEFIPEDEIDHPHPTVLLADELVEDEAYYIVMTTSSGLYRYDIRDVVQCTGFLGTTPLLRFLHKGSHISNLTGEKLTESQVVAAVTLVARRNGLQLQHFTLAPQWGDPPGYALLVDEDRLPPECFPESLSLQIDEELQRGNTEYADKRRSGRLAPVELVPVSAWNWREFIQRRQTDCGSSEEQYKHPFLMPKLEFLDQFPKSALQRAGRRSGSGLPEVR